MKKIRYSFGVLAFVFMVILCGCSDRSKAVDSGQRTYLSHFNNCSFNDAGMVFGTNKSIFFDPVSGQSAPLCARVNCTHNGPDCDANRGNMHYSCAAVIDGYQYFVDSPQLGIMDFYRADPDGTNRRRLHRVEDVMKYWYGSYENGYLIFCYENDFDEHGVNMDKSVSGICLLNLETEKLERIEMPAAYSSHVDEVTIDQGILYYLYYYNLKPWKDYSDEDIRTGVADDNMWLELWKYDLASKEKSMVWKKKFTETDRPQLGYGHIYINPSYQGGKISMEELSTGNTCELEYEGFLAKLPCPARLAPP